MAITPSLAKRYSTKWIYYAWLIIVIGLIIPFRPSFENAAIQIEVPVSVGTLLQPQTPTQSAPHPGSTETATPTGNTTAGNTPIGTTQEPTQTSVPTQNDQSTATTRSLASIPWSTILVAVWLSGAIIVLACHVIRHRRFIRTVWRWGEDVKDNRTLAIWKSVRKEMRITDQIGLQRSELTGSPLLTGISYPRIMLPTTDIPDDEMALILKHELVHYKRKDLWYKGLVLLAVAIHWFNPMVYIIAKTISLQCERSCDDEVIKYKDADSRYEYSAAIIHSIRYAESTTALSTNFFGGKKEMKNRISSIMDMKRKRRGTMLICAVLLITLVVACAFEVTASAPDATPDEVAPPVSVDTPDPVEIVNDPEEPDDSEVISQMAGNWRSQRHESYTANDMIISLFADGTWEWSGPLETDSVDGGSFFITEAEEGIYHLNFLIEHTNSPYTEIGTEFEEILQYDWRNDSMSSLDHSTEIPGRIIIVPYIRVPHSARDAAPTWNEEGLTNTVTSTSEGRVYRFDSLGFAFTLPDSWDDYYEVRGGDEWGIQVYFDAMGVFADLFMIAPYDSFHSEIIGTGQIEEILRFEAGNTEYIMYKSGFRSLVLAIEDYSSHFWDLDDEKNQYIRDTISRMYIETDTIVADSIMVLS